MSDDPDQTRKDRPPRRAQEHFRLDLTREVVAIDDESGLVRMVLTPDPRRYQKIDREEEGNWFLDKYFQTVFNLNDFVSGASGLPVFASERTVDSIEEYASERQAAVASELRDGAYIRPRQSGREHRELELEEEKNVAFVSVDICGSTALRQAHPEGFEASHRILMQELGATVGQFQGSILKTTGDGFIALLDLPSFNVLADSAFDLGGSLLHVLHGAVNPALEGEGFPKLSVRIGADFGPAQIRAINVPLTGFRTLEVTSDALNRAVKIEQSCAPDSFRVGYDLYRIGHVQWLERSYAVDFDDQCVGIPGYQVFEVR
ncbi:MULTISPECIES: adenylate/guanylate cyclase domain-containing protein [unclassified Novosphingobium]|uniref:adenylate/guanylate cyclase domain-containing protein n=1 Tax=unclassified Novosphingobium TaxID=2644732 RepID=UPI0025DAAAB6|nr:MULTISPECIES: adenylate/guanylate cyclase domain-containing protein [unclassified Novosphingobium]HQV03039.1 adenylate/guanylate cyclase domain-containing protein [Novosphingobium sp.]